MFRYDGCNRCGYAKRLTIIVSSSVAAMFFASILCAMFIRRKIVRQRRKKEETRERLLQMRRRQAWVPGMSYFVRPSCHRKVYSQCKSQFPLFSFHHTIIDFCNCVMFDVDPSHAERKLRTQTACPVSDNYCECTTQHFQYHYEEILPYNWDLSSLVYFSSHPLSFSITQHCYSLGRNKKCLRPNFYDLDLEFI